MIAIIFFSAVAIVLMLMSITFHLRRIAEALETQVRAAASLGSSGEREGETK